MFKKMSKKFLKAILLFSTLSTFLVGCGSSGGSYSSNEFSKTDSFAGVSYDTYYDDDYKNNVEISGDKVDYSYSLGANGSVNDKTKALAFYDEASEYIYSKSGRLNDVSNNFEFNDTDDYLSSDDIKYSAQGEISFNAELKEEDVEGLINIFDTFCKNNKFQITVYNQEIINYDNRKVVDYYNEEDYYYENRNKVITQEELDKMLEYSTVMVNVTYHIDRNPIVRFMLSLKDKFGDIFDISLNVLVVIFVVGLFLYISLFLIVLPLIKLFMKSMSKFYKKHPEYKPEKTINIKNDDSYKSE